MLDVILDDNCVITAIGLDQQVVVQALLGWDIDHIRLSVDDELQLVTWPAAHANDVVVVTGFHLKLIGNNLRFTGVRRAPGDFAAKGHIAFLEQYVCPDVARAR